MKIRDLSKYLLLKKFILFIYLFYYLLNFNLQRLIDNFWKKSHTYQFYFSIGFFFFFFFLSTNLIKDTRKNTFFLLKYTFFFMGLFFFKHSCYFGFTYIFFCIFFFFLFAFFLGGGFPQISFYSYCMKQPTISFVNVSIIVVKMNEKNNACLKECDSTMLHYNLLFVVLILLKLSLYFDFFIIIIIIITHYV